MRRSPPCTLNRWGAGCQPSARAAPATTEMDSRLAAMLAAREALDARLTTPSSNTLPSDSHPYQKPSSSATYQHGPSSK